MNYNDLNKAIYCNKLTKKEIAAFAVMLTGNVTLITVFEELEFSKQEQKEFITKIIDLDLVAGSRKETLREVLNN